MDHDEQNPIKTKPTGRWFQFNLKALLLLPVFVGLPLGSYLYWDDWRKHRPPFEYFDGSLYYMAFWSFKADLSAGRVDHAYDSTSGDFKRRMSRREFQSLIVSHPALQQWSESDWVGTHSFQDDYAIAIRGPNQKIVELWVWVASGEDSIFLRRPPPPCVAEIQIRVVAEDEWWKQAFSPELKPKWEWSRERHVEKGIAVVSKDAMDYFDEAIRLDPKDSDAYFNRGTAWQANGELTKAIGDYTEAIRCDRKNAEAFAARGLVWEDKGEFDKALADYDEAIRLEPNDDWSLNRRAWIRATCPNEKYRDGAKAIEDATKACELTDWEDADSLDTFAAAYAEAGQFDKAVEWQQKAIELAPDDEKADFETRLKLYQEGKPYREEPNERGPACMPLPCPFRLITMHMPFAVGGRFYCWGSPEPTIGSPAGVPQFRPTGHRGGPAPSSWFSGQRKSPVKEGGKILTGRYRGCHPTIHSARRAGAVKNWDRPPHLTLRKIGRHDGKLGNLDLPSLGPGR